MLDWIADASELRLLKTNSQKPCFYTVRKYFQAFIYLIYYIYFKPVKYSTQTQKNCLSYLMVNFRIPSSVCCWEEDWRIQVGAQGYIEHCLGQIFEICKREFPTQWRLGNSEFLPCSSQTKLIVWLFTMQYCSDLQRRSPQWRLGNSELFTLLSPLESTVRHFYHAEFSRSAREFHTVCSRE